MTKRKVKPCPQGVHNWGDLSSAYDMLVVAHASGLSSQTLTVICDSCGIRIRFVRVDEKAAS